MQSWFGGDLPPSPSHAKGRATCSFKDSDSHKPPKNAKKSFILESLSRLVSRFYWLSSGLSGRSDGSSTYRSFVALVCYSFWPYLWCPTINSAEKYKSSDSTSNINHEWQSSCSLILFTIRRNEIFPYLVDQTALFDVLPLASSLPLVILAPAYVSPMRCLMSTRLRCLQKKMSLQESNHLYMM